jgi:hypothetical protein|tara:strand:+ start:2963 stop:3277 length:315 start_codon:yes stop_codon:yes gene_type:complete
MQYAQQAQKPIWYQSNNSNHYYSATSGSSIFNEWYEFIDEYEALMFIQETFGSQSFLDHMEFFEHELYHRSDLIIDNVTGEVVGVKSDACINDFQSAVNFESRF